MNVITFTKSCEQVTVLIICSPLLSLVKYFDVVWLITWPVSVDAVIWTKNLTDSMSYSIWRLQISNKCISQLFFFFMSIQYPCLSWKCAKKSWITEKVIFEYEKHYFMLQLPLVYKFPYVIIYHLSCSLYGLLVLLCWFPASRVWKLSVFSQHVL